MIVLKDPDARLDYAVDWTKWLQSGETIVTSTWSVTGGTVTIDSNTYTTTEATVWLVGGAVGDNCQVTNHVTTSAGRTDDRSITVIVQNR